MQEFEWDYKKEQANRRKHGVGFDQAASVFDDPHRLTEPDDHEGEDRMCTTGMTEDGCTMLYVVYTIRETAIRIISARHARPRERRRYGNREIQKR